MMFEYYDVNLHYANYLLNKQIKRYWDACIESGKTDDYLEQRIEKVLIPIVEDKLISDIANGGEHGYGIAEKQGSKLIEMDGICLTSFAGAKKLGYKQQSEGYQFDLEAKKLNEMIDDYKVMPMYQFREKYFVPVPYYKEDALLKHLGEALSKSFLDLEFANNKSIIATVEHCPNVYYAISQFWNANKDYHPKSRVEEGLLYWGDYPVDSVKTVVMFLKNEQDEYKLHSITLTVELEKDKDNELIHRIPCKNEEGEFYKNSFLSNYGKKIETIVNSMPNQTYDRELIAKLPKKITQER